MPPLRRPGVPRRELVLRNGMVQDLRVGSPSIRATPEIPGTSGHYGHRPANYNNWMASKARIAAIC